MVVHSVMRNTDIASFVLLEMLVMANDHIESLAPSQLKQI